MLQPIHPEADTLLRGAATLMLLSVIGLFFFRPAEASQNCRRMFHLLIRPHKLSPEPETSAQCVRSDHF